MWRTQQSQSHVMKATELVVTLILPVRVMETGHLRISLAVQVSLTYIHVHSLTYTCIVECTHMYCVSAKLC